MANVPEQVEHLVADILRGDGCEEDGETFLGLWVGPIPPRTVRVGKRDIGIVQDGWQIESAVRDADGMEHSFITRVSPSGEMLDNYEVQ
jgi:hypothetical protein